MALDVYLADSSEGKFLSQYPSCQFEEDVHEFIFHRSRIDFLRRFPYLSRMIDFYSDSSYEGSAISGLLIEIDEILPQVIAMDAAAESLQAFREVCVAARDANKVVCLFCD